LFLFIFTYGRDTSIMMRLEVNYLDIVPPTLKCSTGWNIQAGVTSWIDQSNEYTLVICTSNETISLFLRPRWNVVQIGVANSWVWIGISKRVWRHGLSKQMS